jgi:hypothetical protein
MSLGWKFALVAVVVWVVAGCLIGPFFSDSGVNPYRAGLFIGRLSPIIGGLAFLAGRFVESR